MDFCIGCRPDALQSADARKELYRAGAREVSLPARALMAGTRDDARALGTRFLDDGLSASTSHPPFGSFNQPFSVLRQSKTGRAEDIQWLTEFIARCGLAGVKAIPLHTGGAMLPGARPWETECALSYVRALLPAAEDANVIIAIENTNHATPKGFYQGAEDDFPLDQNRWNFDDTGRMLAFLEALRSPYARVCYDTGHSHLLGRMMADAKAFLPHTVLYHIHDNDGAGNDAHIQPGYGNAPWGEFFALIAGMQPAPTLFVEAAPRHGDAARMLRELSALADGRVTRKRGGFYEKDDAGRLMIFCETEANA